MLLKPSLNPEKAIEKVTMDHQPPIRRMWRPGFDVFMAKMPKINAFEPYDDEKINITKKIMMELADKLRKLDVKKELSLPEIGENQFGRVILAIEDPTEAGEDLIPGTEIVLALWGPGFTSPVHGHAPGYIHEDLISGSFTVNLYETVEGNKREAIYKSSIVQNTPGIFYSEYVRYTGQAIRSALIHNFKADQFSMSLHYLPEHVRDGNANRFKVVNTKKSGKLPYYLKTLMYKDFKLNKKDVNRVSKSDVLNNFKIGDVYLVRSENVAFLGDHYVIITGDIVQKPHGFRPRDLSILVPYGVKTPLDDYDDFDPMIVLKLSEEKAKEFRELYMQTI